MLFDKSVMLASAYALASSISAAAYDFTYVAYSNIDYDACDSSLVIESGKFHTGTKAAPACLNFNGEHPVWSRIILSTPAPLVKACNLTTYVDAGCPGGKGRLVDYIWPDMKRCSLMGDFDDDAELTGVASMQVACDAPSSLQAQSLDADAVRC